MTNDKTPLADTLAKLRDQASASGRALYDEMVKHLVDTGATAKALRAGDRFPAFQLASAEGRLVTLRDLLARGPAVIAFYRGAWCPWCSAQLKALARAAPEISALGATLVAVTPEAGGTALRTKVDRELDYEILCDLDNTLAFECGIVFRVPDAVKAAYMAKGLDLARLYGNDNWFLPTPATYIGGRDGIIAHAYVNPDFRYRLEPAELLRLLKMLPR
jgi:peroxiredoxin